MIVTVPDLGFTAERAAWIRDNVWPDYYRREHPRSSCSCDGGACGHCWQRHWHTDCTQECHTPWAVPVAYLTDRNGHVKWPAEVAQVWEIGRAHVWVCACKQAGHGGTPNQDALF